MSTPTASSTVFVSYRQQRFVMMTLRAKASGKAPGSPVAAVRGYTVYAVAPAVLKDYDGMNHYAARQLGFRPLPGKREILVSADSKDPLGTIGHEIDEIELMRDRGLTYWEAHRRALEREGGRDAA